MHNIIKTIVSNDINMRNSFVKGMFGLEKENVRVNSEGSLALTPHPTVFGDKLENPYFYNDFSESQVELITPVFKRNEDCYDFLRNINFMFMNRIGDELLWPQSAPPVLPEDEFIPIADFGGGDKAADKEDYRAYLAGKYGRKKQMISGIHYNFSFESNFLEALYEKSKPKTSFKDFRNDIYLKISRSFIHFAWLPTYLFGASPLTDSSYYEKCVLKMDRTPAGDPYFKNATSMRNGVCGYRNHNNYILDYYSVEQYIKELNVLIDDGELKDEREYYSPVRLKTVGSDDFMKTLNELGITYLEFRVLDIDPFDPHGISMETLRFMHLFMMYLLLNDEVDFGDKEHQRAIDNYELVAGHGREVGLELFYGEDTVMPMKQWGIDILIDMEKTLEALDIIEASDKRMFRQLKDMFEDVSLTKSAKVMAGVWKQGYVKWHTDLAMKFKQEAQEKTYQLWGCEDLELSTQILIRDALVRGIKVEFLDRSENFIRLRKGEHIEYVKQATKTRMDSYSTFLMMENKVVTKVVLENHGIRVPLGNVYNSIEEAALDYRQYKDSGFVIKPKSTNFGIGISIFKKGASLEDYKEALRLAFSHDQTVLVEGFVGGKEYRFLVLGDEVVGILHRVPANVTGDGIQTIEMLIKKKNQDPLRGKGYKTPLEYISLGQVELMFLKEQGHDGGTVLEKGQTVYLRENSNISTGGDSIDFTDRMNSKYKEIAIASAKAVDAKICGVDMMIENVEEFDEAYAIIELNFNPAIHIHCYPYEGENRDAGNKVLDLLGF